MIKFIPDSDFGQLLILHAEMHKIIDPQTTDFGAANTLMFEINTKEDFIAVGLYADNNELIGFITGYCFTKKLFHFSGLYVKIKNNIGTKELLDYCDKLVFDKGYSAWQVDATNSNISSIMEKYGAKAKYTRYIKESVDG